MQDRADALAPEAVEELVRRAQKGDSAAFAGLYEAFYGKIFRYILFKTGDNVEAEDLAEEVFLRMLESIDSFKWQGYPFSSWLFRIAHNLIIDYYRKKGRQKTTSLDDVTGMISANSPDMDSNLDFKISIQEVAEAMSGLTKLQQEVIKLRFAAGLSVMETADALGKNENAVKALQHAAIKKLRSLLAVSKGESADDIGAVPQWSR